MKPIDLLAPGLLMSNTARQLLSALAIYNCFSLADKAKPFVVDPLNAVAYKAAFSVSSTFLFLTSITETELSLAFATNRYLPLRVRQRSLGLSPTLTLSVNLWLSVSNTKILSAPHTLT